MARPRKQTGLDQIVAAVNKEPEPEPEVLVAEEPKTANNPAPIQPGDIVQITGKTHKRIAQCPIVHHLEGDKIIAYFPRPGKPEAIQLKPDEVTVVGRARLRYRKEL